MQKAFKLKYSFSFGAALLAIIVMSLSSCLKKSDGIDNNQIIETPYSLFFSDSLGGVYKSNDGKAYVNIFEADGTPCRAISSEFDNVIIVKKNLYTGINGANFSIADTNVTSLTTTDCDGNTVGLNESMILNIPAWGRIYVVCNEAPPDFLGQVISISGGLIGSWHNFDAYYDTFPGHIGYLPINIISFTRLTSGTLCALALENNGGALNTMPYLYRNLYRNDTDIYATPWEEVTGAGSGAHVAQANSSGTPLPTNGFFTLGHYNNRLIAIDAICNNGAYYSDDTGRNWYQYYGIPSGVSCLCISSPFEETCLIGTSQGVYSLNNNLPGFVLQTNNGLTTGTRVNGIAYKENILKSGTVQKYVYLATNKGIFQSVDGGNNWVMTIPGNYTTIY